MELFFEIINYTLSAIIIGISGTWVFLIKSMSDSFRLTPYLDKFQNTSKKTPKVSVILPARNVKSTITAISVPSRDTLSSIT